MAFNFDLTSEKLKIRLSHQLGNQFTAFETAMAQASPVSIRLNPRKASAQYVDNEKVKWCPHGRYLKSRPNFTLDPLFHAGTYYVQEASSMFTYYLVNQLLDLSKNLRVLDLCAAPGGKTSLLQSIITEDSLLVANEIITGRNKILRQNMTRWGGDNQIVTQSDPKSFHKLPGFFDLILVDAPCSGEGLLRKDPAAIDHWSEKNVLSCAKRQRKILSDVLPSLSPGGILLYSTCTFSDEENESNMNWLENNNDLIQMKPEIPDSWGIKYQNTGPGYRFYPHNLKGEGFYIAAYRKLSETGINRPRRKSTVQSLRYEKSNSEDAFWLKSPQRYSFLTRNQHRIAIPNSLIDDYHTITSNLRVTASGLNMGKIYHGKLKPSPELALSQGLSPTIPTMILDQDHALDYLAHIGFGYDSALSKGRYLVNYDGHGLGWINILQNGQVRNNYPSAWRILYRKPEK